MSRFGSTSSSRREAKPSFIIKPRRCFADEGATGKFRASFEGDPTPSIEWVRKGVKIEPSDKYKIYQEKDFHILEITQLATDDRGQYTCVLANSLGTNRVTAELEVYASRVVPKKLDNVPHLRKTSKSTEKLHRSTERLTDSPEPLAKTSRKFAKSSENLTSGVSLSLAPAVAIDIDNATPTPTATASTPPKSRREISGSGWRLTVEGGGSTGRGADRSPRRSEQRSPSPRNPPAVAPKSPNTRRSVKSRVDSRRSESEDTPAKSQTTVKLSKVEVSKNSMETNNNEVNDDSESGSKSPPTQPSEPESSEQEADANEPEVSSKPHPVMTSEPPAEQHMRSEIRVTSTAGITIQSKRRDQEVESVAEKIEPPRETAEEPTRTQKTRTATTLHMSNATEETNRTHVTPVAKVTKDVKVSSVRDRFESPQVEPVTKTVQSTKLNLAPSAAKLSSVRNKFETAAAAAEQTDKARSYGKVDVTKAGIRSGKLASLSKKFASFEQQDSGPILPKPPPQPSMYFAHPKTSSSSVASTTLKIDPRNQAADTPKTSEAASRRAKSHDIPEISVSSAVEFKLQVSTPQAEASDAKEEPEKPETRVSQEPEEDSQQKVTSQEPEPEVVPAPMTVSESAIEPALEKKEVPSKQTREPANSAVATPKPKETATKTTLKTSPKSKSLDVPSDDANLKRASSKEKLNRASSSAKSPRASPIPKRELSPQPASLKRDKSPRASHTPRKDASPRRDAPSAAATVASKSKAEKAAAPAAKTTAAAANDRHGSETAEDSATTSDTKKSIPTTTSATHASVTAARLRPTRSQPAVVKPLGDVTVEDGESLTLECAFSGSPTPQISWYFNNVLLKDSEEIQQLFDGEVAQLKFKDVFPDDTGHYEAIATNRIGEAKTTCTLTVRDASPMSAPAFTKQLQDTVVCDGDALTLRAHYTGVPEPAMVWYHDGQEVVPSKDFKVSVKEGQASLQFMEVFPEDQGLYELMATNEKGEAKTSCNLTVNEPGEEVGSILKKFNQKAAVQDDDKPIFIRTLKDMTATDGDKVTLQVEVTGCPPIDVVWIHDKEELNPADQSVYQVLSNGNLHRVLIADVLPEDQGRWSCEAYNDFGDAETHCVLTVKEPPPAGKHVTSVEQHMREEVVDEDLARDQNILQTRKNKIQNEDTLQAPKFIIKPKSKNIVEGNSVKFVCEVVGNPQPNVSWMFQGREIGNNGRFKISRDGWKHVFEISHTLATDAGHYECTASNSQGSSVAPIELVVKRLDSPQGGVTDFRTLLKARPDLGVVSPGASPVKQDAGQVSFRNVLKSAKNTDSPEASAKVGPAVPVKKEPEQLDFRNVLTRHVKTKVRPRVLQELRDVKAMEGNAVTLTCKVTGTPPPEISWLHGKKEVKESRYFQTRYEGDVATLQISSVYPEDAGEYRCVCENEAGSVSSKCDVTVQESLASSGGGGGGVGVSTLQPQSPTTNTPTAVTPATPSSQYLQDMEAEEPPFIEDLQPENVGVLRGNQFKLKACFVGSAPLQISWTKGRNDVLAPDERVKIDTVRDTTSLTILRSAPTDSGKYTVAISNAFGTDTMSASVTVEDKPDAPVGQPVASNIRTNSLSLAWSGPSYDGGSGITDYRVEQCLNGQDAWRTLTSNCKHTSFNVTGLDANTEYIFRVSAANKHGFGPPGKPSDVIVTVVRHFSHLSDLGDLDIMTFTPRVVEVTPGRAFKDYYVLGEEIGKGRFGSVYTCVEKSAGQQFAAKFIKVKPSQRAEVKQEMSIMNELHHPKLLLLWDAFESAREMILVMEHVKGGELFERIIDDDYCLTERECVHFMRQTCDGIAFMHSANILHLDLKPENVLCITPNSNEIKIIDFGLARRFDPSVSTKVLFGTPEFVAPEVINYDQIGYATDMWSLGVICYILVSGLSPFLGDSEAETLANVTMATWDFEDEAFEDISDDCKDFMSQLLVKNMRKRLSATAALEHKWMSQDVQYMRAKRLSTARHKRFMARGKWQKTGHAIRALGRMASLQKALCLSRQSSNGGGAGSTGSSSMRSRQSSMASDISSSSGGGVSPGSERPATRTSRTANRSGRSRGDSAEELNHQGSLTDNGHPSHDASIDEETFTSSSSTERQTTCATSRASTRSQSGTSDMNSNNIDVVQKTSTTTTTTTQNGVSRARRIEHQAALDNKPEVESESVTSQEVMSQEEVTSPEVMSESDDREMDREEAQLAVEEVEEEEAEEEVEEVVEEVEEVEEEEGEEKVEEEKEEEVDENTTEPVEIPSDGTPVFTKKLSDFKTYEGDSARFDATVSGTPEPDIQWLKNDMPIVVNRRKYIMDFGAGGACSLIVKFCDEDDAATYTCRASNERGQSSTSAQLTVKTFGSSRA